MVQKDEAEKEPRTQKRARAPPALLDRNVELHYRVERVVQERRRSGKRQRFVKRRGYSSLQNSWEPESRIRVDCPKGVEIWDQKQPPGRKYKSLRQGIQIMVHCGGQGYRELNPMMTTIGEIFSSRNPN
ncbi:Pol protein [Phytophthora palmivora]|uniref:Pol protein n=1 Tax=Phytophthora palmivora TaxID=4796 RepID=A0A2P4Y6M3_9STRA|nr:Pol protein [Phytophthora palmivora]